MTEPFADEARLRAGWAAYQLGHGRPMTEPPLLAGTVDVPTLLLYGTDDHVVGDDFVHVLRAWRSPTASARCSSPAPATSSSGSAPTSSTRC